MVKRGEVWLVALDPTMGAEIRKTRPGVVVSPDELNVSLRTVLVVPMTTAGRPAPFRLPVRFQRKQGLALCDQVRALDRTRLTQRLGRLDPTALANLLRIMSEMFAA